MPYWITSTLAATPAFAWIYCGLGLVWALVALPRKDWRDVPLVLCVAFALGPALLTAWMFVLGTIGGANEQPLIRPDLIIGGTFVLALIGAVMVWRKRKNLSPSPSPQAERGTKFAADEKLLIGLIITAFVLQWLSVAYWPFTAYDTLWVYGYEGRLYSLLGYIPAHIDYYPPFIPLQYAYGQLAVGGLGFVDDHAARAVLPFINVGSILAVYALGSRLFTRRTGIIAAALWALYPHVGEWSRFGDLEIPVAFLFTTSSVFFLMAWTTEGHEPRRRYAAIAGIMFGIAMWTKPTAGAFAWGVALLTGVELVRLRFDWRAWRPKFELALITALASAPLGGVWYVRNLLLGHNPIDFPPAYWLTQAQRSGAEFGWPLLALLILLAYLYLAPHTYPRPNLLRVVIGVALVAAGLLPSIIQPHRMGALEWLALAAGSVVLAVTLWKAWEIRAAGEPPLQTLSCALLIALPYFVTWFYSYSYHYRLSFAIVPLLLLPTAVVLAHWFTRERIASLKLPLRLAYLAVIALIGIPGVISTLNDVYAGNDWLWTDELPDDFQRYNSGNRALMNVVGGIQTYMREHDEPPVIVAPAEQRLPFFFPLMDIRTDVVPTDLDELQGVTYFIYSSQSGGAYEQIPLAQSQVFASLGRGADVMRHAWDTTDIPDGNFYYEVYEPHPEQRFVEPQPIGRPDGEVLFGDFARLIGYDLSGLEFWPGRRIGMKIMWQVLDTPTVDYSIFVHLMRGDELIKSWDGPPAASDHGYYTTLVWEAGEYVTDERILRITEDETLPPVGEDYHLVIGMYDLQTQERLPITINGETFDSYTLPHEVSILPADPNSE